jgi:hypothetical protein
MGKIMENHIEYEKQWKNRQPYHMGIWGWINSY